MKRPVVARDSEPKTCHLQLGQPVRSMPLASAFSSAVASGPTAPACLSPTRKSTICKQPYAISVPFEKSAIHDLQVHAAATI